MYQYFYMLIKNESATPKIKNQILKKYLDELLHFSRNCDDGNLLVEEEVALDIFKYILNTDNIEERKRIYSAFLQAASNNASEYFSASFRSPIQLR